MLLVLRNSWALLLGLLLFMVGNGLQGTLMGVRGAIEGFSTLELSFVTSAYFLGFLGGSRLAPGFIRRVGHVRLFAALGSMISAVLILYPVLTDPFAWIVLRVVIGFCLSGVYVTAESWLNNSSTNETRGQALSAYMIVQMVGLIAAQGLLNLADPAGYLLFIIPSVLVSVAFAPILLSISPTPAFEATRTMSLPALYRKSPLGFVSMGLMGGVFAGQFGMGAIYATAAGLSVAQISIFMSAFFVGALVLQYPIGWMSDRMDRRLLILATSALAGAVALVGMVLAHLWPVLIAVALLSGGLAQPMYALIIAYTNDYLEPEEMAAASSGLLFINGLGAILGPPLIGWSISTIGPQGYWLFMAVTLLATALYALWRMTQRPSAYAEAGPEDQVSYAPILPTATAVVLEAAQEIYADASGDQADETAARGPPADPWLPVTPQPVQTAQD